ncbi:MAG: carboxypeptidase regulatory-like domain-containing protein [Pyrinomonadaceae bacterium]
MPKLRNCSFIIALLLCVAATAFGQETTGTIEGTIKDPNGAVVPGVQVTVTSAGTTEGARQDATTGVGRTFTTDENGFFRVLQIPPGFYTITTAPTAGFGSATLTNIEVVLGKNTPVNVTLAAGGQNINVDVTSENTSPIDPTDNKIQTNITSQIAELLPKGVNFTSLLTVAPAVRAEPASGGFQIDGASGAENTFIIDGQEVTNFRTGALNGNNNIPFQFVQEVQVKSSGFEAEFGGATGGVINVVTKGGSNDFHGEFGLSFRPAQLQASPRRFLTNAFGGASTVQPRRDEGTDEFPSATFSGPILKDRLWFLVSHTPQYRHLVRNVDFINPSNRAAVGSGRFTQDQRNDYDFVRLDANIFSKLRFNGSYTYNPIALRGIPPAFGDELTSTLPSTTINGVRRTGTDFLNNRGGRQNSQNVTGGFVFTPLDNLVINARGGYSFLNEKLDSYGVPNVVGQIRSVCSTLGVASAIPAEAGCSFGTSTGPSIQTLLFDVSRRKTFDADATYLTNFGGRHQFKGGYQLNALSNNVDLRTIDQVILYFGRSINQRSGIDATTLPPTPGAIGSGLLQRFARRGSASSRNNAFYIQDSYQPVSRLSLNFGVRTETENVPSFIAGRPSIKFDYRDKIAPRLGVAYDLTGDGKTKLFASYGRFFDRFKYELPRGSFGGEFFRRDYFEIFPGGGAFTSYTPARILGGFTDPFGGACPIPGAARGTTRCQFDFRVPSNAGLGLDSGAIDPDIKPFRQSEFTVGAERDLGGGYLFRGRYTRKNVDRAVEDIGFSSSTGSEAYIIGNPGEGLAAQVAQQFGFLPLKAQRTYNAFEVNLDKRFTKRYYFNANYTYSRLFGNYSGLASSDEAGRLSPNVNRYFDLPFIGFTAQGRPDNGLLPTDRPHVFKFYGAYTLDWTEQLGFGRNNSTEFSAFTTAESGIPLTTRFTFLNVDNQILSGRGDLGRTEKFTQTDLALRHKYRFGSNERLTMSFDFDVLNVFNESNVLAVFENIQPAVNVSGSGAGLSSNSATAEGQFQRQNTLSTITNFINANGGNDPRYRVPRSFQNGRQVRFGFRLLF